MQTIMVRFGEIALKGEWVRREFEKKLMRNISSVLDFEHELLWEWGRIFVNTNKIDNAIRQMSNVPGIVSISPCEVTESRMDRISEKAVEIAKNIIKPGENFALRVKRTGTHDFKSHDVAVVCGDAINRSTGAKVNLTAPDREIFIEVRQEKAYIYTRIFDGLGGLPVGTQGSVVSLISGGIDSPVATFLMLKRGCKVYPVHFDNRPFADEMTIKRVKDVYENLKVYSSGEDFDLTLFPYGRVWQLIVEKAPRPLTCILCKRGMVKLAEKLAIDRGCLAIVTGESLGQVASQTLPNLRVITYGIELPIFRPLITHDKVETTDIARKILTYDSSIQKARCCAILPERPATSAKLEKVIEVEKDIGFDETIQEVYEESKSSVITH